MEAKICVHEETNKPGNRTCSRMDSGIQLLSLQLLKGPCSLFLPDSFLLEAGGLLTCSGAQAPLCSLGTWSKAWPCYPLSVKCGFQFHVCLGQRLSTGVLRGFSKHATPDYLVRGFDDFSVRLSKKRRRRRRQQPAQ